MATISVEIVSAERAMWSGEAEMVVASAEAGDVGISPGHTAFISRLRPGEVRVINAGEEEAIFVSGGILEVQPRQVTVLADTAMRGEEMDEAAAEEAKRRAQDMMLNKSGEIDIERAQRELVQAAAQLQFIKKLRAKR